MPFEGSSPQTREHTASTLPSPPDRAHPRGRGEHEIGIDDAFAEVGSSPRARGAQEPMPRIRRVAGLIPAGAGSTSCRVIRWRMRGAHPRRRGEHLQTTSANRPRRGSSPQAREHTC